MNDSKRKYRLVAFIIILIILLIVLIAVQHSHSPSYTKEITSRDTGETVDFLPNVTEEKQAGGGQVIVFGSYLLLNNGATEQQLKIIRNALNDYLNKKLGNQYKYLTFVPDTFSSNGGEFKSKIRLGDSDRLVDSIIKIWDLRYAQVKITDSSVQNNNVFDSGVLTAS